VPTLRIKPVETISKLVCCSLDLGGVPGRSTKEMSVYSGPVISKQTMSGENDSSPVSLKSTSSSTNLWDGMLGFRMACWAQNTRCSNNSLSVITAPKGSFVCPDADTRRKKTRHDHSGPSPRIRRHSIGHLQGSGISPTTQDEGTRGSMLTSCMHPPVPSGVALPRWLESATIFRSFASQQRR